MERPNAKGWMDGNGNSERGSGRGAGMRIHTVPRGAAIGPWSTEPTVDLVAEQVGSRARGPAAFRTTLSRAARGPGRN
jgi:hypothetical protein